jgi:hypothetical protein
MLALSILYYDIVFAVERGKRNWRHVFRRQLSRRLQAHVGWFFVISRLSKIFIIDY